MDALKEYFKIAVKNLRTRSMRSWLTIIGIVIGVFLIISLLSLTEGIKQAILKELKMMGEDLIMVMPGEVNDMVTSLTGGLELTEEDIEAVKRTKGVESVVPLSWKAEIVRYEGNTKTIIISGNPWKDGQDIFKNDMGWQVAEGHWPTPGKNEVLVGAAVPRDIFPEMELGTKIVIKGKKFEVVGILKSLGNKQDDSMIHMDLDSYRNVTGERKGAKFIFAKISSSISPDEAVENIKDSLYETRKRRRGEDLPSFTVLTSEKMLSIAGNIIGLIQIAIFSLASIAIVVGGIGIMNTMYTSVNERVREIGIMKAVGAKRSTITNIFLIESGILGMVGGIGGVALGLGLAKAVEIYLRVYPVFYLKASMSPYLILFGLTFSFLIGCVSGFLPARKAARMKPVDALRYE